jgi:hypothetical protein
MGIKKHITWKNAFIVVMLGIAYFIGVGGGYHVGYSDAINESSDLIDAADLCIEAQRDLIDAQETYIGGCKDRTAVVIDELANTLEDEGYEMDQEYYLTYIFGIDNNETEI